MASLEQQREYWRNRRPRAVVQNPLVESLECAAPRLVSEHDTVGFTLPAPVAEELLRVSNASDLSLFILLVAMFKSVARRYGGNDEVTILAPGYSVDGSSPAAELVILQDRVQLADDLRVTVLETRRTVVGAYSNQAVHLAELYGPELADAVTAANPLCASTNLHGTARPARCPLELRFSRAEREIACTVSYDAARLRPELVRELCANLEQFIEAASEDFTMALERVAWLRGERRSRVAAMSKGPLTAVPAVSLDELVEVQVRRTPDASAVVFGAQTVSYALLDATAEAAAGRLVQLGVQPGDLVALRLEPGIDLVVALLAVLKAGAAFVPIAAGDPPARVGSLLRRCSPQMLLVNTPDDALASPRQIELSCLSSEGVVQRPARTTVASTAYVIFTSGSSGEPKGVVIDHRGIVNAVAWKAREYAFKPGDRVLPLFGYEFDGFVLNLFAPLCAGAAVVLLEDEERVRPARVAAALQRHRVTHLAAAPLLYDAVLDYAGADGLRGLHRVTLAGEAASPETIARSGHLGPHVLVSNEYGPTENSVVSTCQRELTSESARVIGRPIDNVVVLVHDERGEVVPPGVTGEIVLGGAGLARGYLGGDDGGAFSDRTERLYRTGDLGRWLPDGALEFQGRREHLVKVRGKRVDLEEIRAVLRSHVGVRDALVMHAGDPTDGTLAAFVVADSLDGLDGLLRKELPAHAVPSRLLRLDALPRSAGGKLDTAALRSRLQEPLTAEPPSNEVERTMIDVWRRVLEIERVGVDNSFFALGGHSLRAVRLLAEIHQAFGVELQLNQIFSANTVRSLSNLVAAALREREGEPPHDTTEVCALTSAQERMLALTHEHGLSYNLPVLFAIEGELDVPRLETALRALVERHDSLRASFHPEGDRWVQRIGDPGAVSVTERALEGSIEDAAQASLAPFDLSAAPLFRVVLFRADGRSGYLLFDFHHIILDEVSLAHFFCELAELYNGGTLPAPTGSYAAYAAWQQRQRASEAYRAQLERAAAELRGLKLEPLRLPYDFPQPRRRSHRGDVVRRRLPPELVTAARDLCAASEVTVFSFFMAVLGLLLHKYTHQSTIVVGAPVSLRGHRTRDVVGLFLNTIPFKLQFPSSDCSFLAYLRDVASGVINDLGRSHVEFDDLVKALRIERRLGENPLFDVLVNIVDANATRLSFDGVRASRRPLHSATSKFALVLELDLDESDASAAFEFSTERFRRATVERLADGLVALLVEVIADPSAPLARVQVLRPAERDQLLEWGGVHRFGSYEEGSLASHFERRVGERSSAVALVYGDETVTYGELNARANRLARELLSLGCGEDGVVAVFCERSPAAIAGILAVQKAGGAHLPLDPFYPAARTAKMLADSGARVLITDRDVTALGFGGVIVRADVARLDRSPDDLRLPQRPESLAYVLYTSGTTGGPKGVMVEQRNVVTLVQRATSALEIDHNDVWSLFHSLCFDVSVWEMFGSLLRGSRLVIVPRTIAADPDRVLDLIERNRITVLCQPPSAFYLLADAMLRRGQRRTTLRYAILGGEAIKLENLGEWWAHYDQTH